jgi:glycosyltransferase involved in cell wall biosynthesis
LFLGNIVRYKRVDLLIKAVNILKERGVNNIIVTIAGNCRNWADYQSYIKYPELLDLKIERIPDDEIADLFEYNHYFVMPYQDIAQSGALFMALTYNVPTIISDIPQFKEFVIEGKTCLTFRSEDEESLADTMQYAINHHKDFYDSMRIEQKRLFEDNYSEKTIVSKYIDFFEKL